MNSAGTYSNGDQRYETTYSFQRGAFPNNSVLGDLFGSSTSQFRMSVVDSGQQTHSFPHLEFGNNVPMTTPVTSPSTLVSATAGTRRSLPQVLAAGFDPMIIDLADTSFDAVAIVRAGVVPVSTVSISQNQGGFSMAMNLVETLPNGDQKYKITYTYQRGAFPATRMADLFGTQPSQFNFVVTDQAQQTHHFPELRVGNHPAMSTSTSTCISSQVLTNGVCVTPAPSCTSAQVLTNGVCVTPPPTYAAAAQVTQSIAISPICTSPQVLTNGVCVTPPPICTSPQVLTNGVCVTPPPICTSPQVLTNGVCVTPAPTCTSAQVLTNGVCVTPAPTCTSAQVLTNGVCVTPAPTCTSAQVLTNGVCVTPAPAYVTQGGMTWMPPSSTTYAYAEAAALCGGTINGQTAWRLPTYPELTALYTSGAVNGHGWMFLSLAWSSTPGGIGVHYIRSIGDNSGGSALDTYSNFIVTCVR